MQRAARARPSCCSAISAPAATMSSAAFAAAEDFGADAYEMCVNAMPSWTKVGVETIGRCKGTLEAIKSADMLVCLHIPLFTRWLKRGARRRHPRAHGHRRARRARNADVAARPEGGGRACRQAARARQDHAHHASRRHRSHGQARRISHHDPVRLCGSARPFRSLGRRPCPYLPQRGLGQRHAWCSRPATSSCCPIAATCRTRCGSTSATASSARSKAASTPS